MAKDRGEQNQDQKAEHPIEDLHAVYSKSVFQVRVKAPGSAWEDDIFLCIIFIRNGYICGGIIKSKVPRPCPGELEDSN